MSNSASTRVISTNNNETTELHFLSRNSSAGNAKLKFNHDTTSSNRNISFLIDDNEEVKISNSKTIITRDLQLTSNIIKANDGTTALTLSGANLNVAGNLVSTNLKIGDGSNNTTLNAPSSGGAVSLTLPTSTGSNGQFLQTNGSGVTDCCIVFWQQI